jgi:hypothetical protein
MAKSSNRSTGKQEGPTIFDWLLDIIAVHGHGGEEAKDGVELELE